MSVAYSCCGSRAVVLPRTAKSRQCGAVRSGRQTFHATTPRHARRRDHVTVIVSAQSNAEATAQQVEVGSSELSVFSPSKINVFLRVTARRPDGFHDLASLFHVIDFGDTLNLTKLDEGAEQDSMTSNKDDIPLDESNLVMKAFQLFREKTGVDQRFSCHLEKQVPAGGGLGGGSGNAATALWAVNRMCGTEVDDGTLMEWSAALGSDCPIFFSHGPAYCTGRGDIVEDMPPPIDLATPMVLMLPHLFCSTPAIFKALDLDSRSTADPRQLLDRIAKEGMQQELCINDLEQPAFANMPKLEELKATLLASGQYESVFMSGSGSTIVCTGSDEEPTLSDEDKQIVDLLQPTRLITRKPGEWYSAP